MSDQPGRHEQADREVEVVFKFKTYGNEEQSLKSAIQLVRTLRTSGFEPTSALCMGFDLAVDDFADDGGEYWHAHDWRGRDPKDEGLHPTGTIKSAAGAASTVARSDNVHPAHLHQSPNGQTP